MSNKTITLKPSPQGLLRYAHPWVYRNQIHHVAETAKPGDLVALVSHSGRLMARGYWNPKSEIAVRILTWADEAVSEEWWESRIQAALDYRKKMGVHGWDAYRVVASEADGLPGLIVDKYGSVYVVQILTLGMEKMRNEIKRALMRTAGAERIYERSVASSRSMEGLEDRVQWLSGEPLSRLSIREGDLELEMDLEAGHKTGWYLDQRENRMIVSQMAIPGGDALDVFCYQGGFGLHLAKAGMKVLAVDSQQDVLLRAQRQRDLNGLSEAQLQFQKANAFDLLKHLDKDNRRFDLIVLDPPSFVKQKSALAGAVSGYREILQRSFKMVKPGGMLAVFSCAYYLDDSHLMQASMAAAKDAKKRLMLVRFLKQSADHPIQPFIPETYYLKGFLFQVS